jgi:hypothetical protein
MQYADLTEEKLAQQRGDNKGGQKDEESCEIKVLRAILAVFKFAYVLLICSMGFIAACISCMDYC